MKKFGNIYVIAATAVIGMFQSQQLPCYTDGELTGFVF